jgi:hypothetical protein
MARGRKLAAKLYSVTVQVVAELSRIERFSGVTQTPIRAIYGQACAENLVP